MLCKAIASFHNIFYSIWARVSYINISIHESYVFFLCIFEKAKSAKFLYYRYNLMTENLILKKVIAKISKNLYWYTFNFQLFSKWKCPWFFRFLPSIPNQHEASHNAFNEIFITNISTHFINSRGLFLMQSNSIKHIFVQNPLWFNLSEGTIE